MFSKRRRSTLAGSNLALKRWLLSNSAIGFVSKKGRGPFLPPLLWRLSKAHTWPAAVLVDELETAGSTLRE
jgi:hypothetical protein